MLRDWVDAARPRTLPASASPVVAATAYAWHYGVMNVVAAVICLLFALLAQIASNFANDYYDYKKGSDRADRVGPRRAVASGDISPKSMLMATLLTLIISCGLGLALLIWGGWWLILAGMIIVVFAIAYSAGPYPLSYKGLGDVAVFIFFGLVAVNLTYYVQALHFCIEVFWGSVAIGLLSVNILMVNNYRDVEADRLSGKKTVVVRFGHTFARYAYLFNGVVALLCTVNIWFSYNFWSIGAAILFFCVHIITWRQMCILKGTALNPVLGKTARNLLIFTIFLSIFLIL